MHKIIFIILTLFLPYQVFANSGFFDDDGYAVTVVTIKECFFHGEIYETHMNTITPCSFNVSHMQGSTIHSHAQQMQASGAITDIPHNPECFGEGHRSTPLRL